MSHKLHHYHNRLRSVNPRVDTSDDLYFGVRHAIQSTSRCSQATSVHLHGSNLVKHRFIIIIIIVAIASVRNID